MAARPSVFSSSIGTKLLISLTGLALFAYLILHLAGNVLVFMGPSAFNTYSYRLISNPLVVPAEIGLLLIFLLHIYKAVAMWIDNQRARPVKYVTKKWAGGPSRKSLASSTMIGTGIVTLLFVVVHLRNFKYGTEYVVTNSQMRDLFRLEMETFSNPVLVAFYVVCMVVIGFHLWHGFSSAFQSLGADHPRYTPRIRLLGRVFAIIIAGGFLLIPLWVYFVRSRS
jgi:succinate dehydrogenase / fumarate reductase cytochrome b subunit